jgi:hypothetical protein
MRPFGDLAIGESFGVEAGDALEAVGAGEADTLSVTCAEDGGLVVAGGDVELTAFVGSDDVLPALAAGHAGDQGSGGLVVAGCGDRSGKPVVGGRWALDLQRGWTLDVQWRWPLFFSRRRPLHRILRQPLPKQHATHARVHPDSASTASGTSRTSWPAPTTSISDAQGGVRQRKSHGHSGRSGTPLVGRCDARTCDTVVGADGTWGPIRWQACCPSRAHTSSDDFVPEALPLYLQTQVLRRPGESASCTPQAVVVRPLRPQRMPWGRHHGIRCLRVWPGEATSSAHDRKANDAPLRLPVVPLCP